MKTGLSFLADLLLVVTVPYIALYYAYSFVFRCHLRLSGATYLLFRGRGREQENSRLSKTFFLEHVIVGILLLTPLLFLLPTVFVYYLFWALIFLALKVGLGLEPYSIVFFFFWTGTNYVYCTSCMLGVC